MGYRSCLAHTEEILCLFILLPYQMISARGHRPGFFFFAKDLVFHGIGSVLDGNETLGAVYHQFQAYS